MSDVSDAIDEARAEIASAASKFLPRTCSLIPQIKASDGLHGHKLVDGTAIPNIPCTVESQAGGYQVNEGGSVVTRPHKLTLPVTSDTVGIKKNYRIDVDAQGLTPAMKLEHPILQLSDLDVLLTVYASFAEGYRQPAST